MKSLKIICVVAGLIVAFTVAPAAGGPVNSTFSAQMAGDPGNWNVLAGGGGSGWQDGTGQQWFSYPQETALTDPAGNQENAPMWWNQWFYNDDYDLTRWKIIDLTFTASQLDPDYPAYVVVTINWSTGDHPNGTGAPPLPSPAGGPPPPIGRLDPQAFPILAGTYSYELTDFKLPIPYNPEWVSMDIRGYNFEIEGVLIHECVPAPGAILLGSLGVGLVGWLRRRRAL